MTSEHKDLTIAEKIFYIKECISDAEKKASRTKGSVRLVAVSKFHPVQSVIEAIEAGHHLFGENRVQEASSKFDEIRNKGYSADLHIIGTLQRNKVKEAVRISSCIESVDRIELLIEIEKQCAKIQKNIEIYFELHTGEASKSGFSDEGSLEKAVLFCAEGNTPHCIPSGFMTMAPNTNNDKLVHDSFSKLRHTAEKMKNNFSELPLNELSMGMSQDYPIAIEEGATIVRVGTAIFGVRSL